MHKLIGVLSLGSALAFPQSANAQRVDLARLPSIDTITAATDVRPFLAPGMPDTIKQKALRKIWSTDPILSQIDPLQDYAEDFTDEAVAVPAGMLKTAYRIGRGFLSDDEVAEWERLGNPGEIRIGALPVGEQASATADALRWVHAAASR
jgi:hypothetical protein